VRWREITKEENAYEVLRREDILKVLNEEIGIKGLDPPSVGSQFYRKEFLNKLLEIPIVKNYEKRWGFELLLDLVSVKLGINLYIVHIEKGNYVPSRRQKEKVDAQYDSYIEIIAQLNNKPPESLSKLYKGNI